MTRAVHGALPFEAALRAVKDASCILVRTRGFSSSLHTPDKTKGPDKRDPLFYRRRGTLGVFYKPLTLRDEDEERRVPILKHFYLFNLDQVEGIGIRSTQGDQFL